MSKWFSEVCRSHNSRFNFNLSVSSVAPVNRSFDMCCSFWPSQQQLLQLYKTRLNVIKYDQNLSTFPGGFAFTASVLVPVNFFLHFIQHSTCYQLQVPHVSSASSSLFLGTSFLALTSHLAK